MGAGRGMLGLAAAGVANDNIKNQQNVQLIMMERTGSRSKTDNAFRKVPKDADTSCMKLDGVQWSRCSCDLAHIHLPTLLDQQQHQQHQQVTATTSVAKEQDVEPSTKKLLFLPNIYVDQELIWLSNQWLLFVQTSMRVSWQTVVMEYVPGRIMLVVIICIVS
jgi:Methyltransferase TRM13